MLLLLLMNMGTAWGATSGVAFQPAWARNCNNVLSEGEPR